MRGIPALTDVAKKYRDQVNVVGVSVHETDQAKVALFVDKMDFHVAMDRQKSPTTATGFMSEHWMESLGCQDRWCINGSR